MPIFEYSCEGCGGDFELLVRSDTRIACPACGGLKLRKKLSLFSSRVARKVEALPPCHGGAGACDPGRCGSGSCGLD